jgi:hypothetical protein
MSRPRELSVTSNVELQAWLDERGLEVSRLVRYVYLVEDEERRLLCVRRVAQLGNISGELYLGWQPLADFYWGSYLFDEEFRGLAAECIRQHTQRDVLATLRFREAFFASSQGQPVLHLVLHARCSSAEGFEWWSDWDDEWAWLSADEALQRCGFEEDRRAIALALTTSTR